MYARPKKYRLLLLITGNPDDAKRGIKYGLVSSVSVAVIDLVLLLIFTRLRTFLLLSTECVNVNSSAYPNVISFGDIASPLLEEWVWPYKSGPKYFRTITK